MDSSNDSGQMRAIFMKVTAKTSDLRLVKFFTKCFEFNWFKSSFQGQDYQMKGYFNF